MLRSSPKIYILLMMACWYCLVAPLAAKDCGLVKTGRVPLFDLGPGSYRGSLGGLYPNGSNRPPELHLQEALRRAAQEIRPRNAAGEIDLQNGRIVLISIGMSNTTQEFATRGPGAFKPRMEADASQNPALVLVDGAQGGRAAVQWADPNDSAWTVANQRLQASGVTPAQVQVAWVKLAERTRDLPSSEFPNHAQWHQENLAKVVRLLKQKYPRLQIAYLSSRTRAYEANPRALNPEPIAYEENFSVKWLIESQVTGGGDLNFDPAKGVVAAPLLLWGPYLWIDGLDARSDGLTWECSDTANDGMHPSPEGVAKVADQLIAFFKTEPSAANWFLRNSLQAGVRVKAEVLQGPAPLSVRFSAEGAKSKTISQWAWNFGDGGLSLSEQPSKVYLLPGTYPVRLTATDSSGNVYSDSVNIQVTGDGLGASFYFPLLADGPSGNSLYRTRIILLNTGAAATVRLSFFDRDGRALPLGLDDRPAAAVHEIDLAEGAGFAAQTQAAGQSLAVGYALVQSTAEVSGTAVFTRIDARTGIPLTAAAVPAGRGLEGFAVFADTTGHRNTGLALVHGGQPSGWTAPVRVSVRLLDGSRQELGSRVIELQPGQAVARFARGELFPEAGAVMGTMVAESDGPVVALALLQEDSGAPFPAAVPLLTALPVSPTSSFE